MRWVLPAGLVAWAAVRAAGLEAGFPLVALLAFTPFVVIAGALVAAGLAVARAWAPAATAAVATAAIALMVAPRAIGEESAAGTFTVMTANVAYGRTDPAVVARLAAEHDVDVLAIQELTPEHDEALAPRFAHVVEESRPGAQGTGLYSRVPIQSRGTIPGMLFANVRAAGRGFQIASVHPPPPTRERIDRWKADLRRLPAATPTAILAGDFNATLDHAEFRRLLDTGYADAAERTGDGLTPTWRGRVAIDHVLVGSAWRVTRTRVVDLPGSDHEAVVAELVRASSGAGAR